MKTVRLQQLRDVEAEHAKLKRAYAETRHGVLDMLAFRDLTEVREQAERWLADYNKEISHDSLRGFTLASSATRNFKFSQAPIYVESTPLSYLYRMMTRHAHKKIGHENKTAKP